MPVLYVFSIIIALSAGSSWAGDTLLSDLEAEIAEMVERTRPNVVTVYARGLRRTDWVSQGSGRLKFGNRTYWQENVGSGLLFDSEGYVLTMGNVVSGASQIAVGFVESEERRAARLVGLDDRSGVAVIKLEGVSGSRGVVSHAPTGNSDRMRPGHWAIIIGNSFGASSASLGLICGTPQRGGLIQLTARACPGNSGAPVFDSRGRVVGILVGALASPQAFRDRIESVADGRFLPVQAGAASLALPINRARVIAHRLIRRRDPGEGWLGVVSRPEERDIEIQGGVPISRVIPDSPADRAGLRPGDLVLEYGRHRILDLYDLVSRVKYTSAGTSVDIQIQRGDQRIELPVEIGRRSAEGTR